MLASLCRRVDTVRRTEDIGRTIIAVADVPVLDLEGTLQWTLVSGFMAMTSLFFALALSENTEQRLNALLAGYIACAALLSVVAILAYFLRFKRSGWSILDPMQPDAYGIFLVHYPIVLWLQYAMFDYDLSAIVKAPVAFVLTVIFSWAVTRALRPRSFS